MKSDKLKKIRGFVEDEGEQCFRRGYYERQRPCNVYRERTCGGGRRVIGRIQGRINKDGVYSEKTRG